jgi:hypothetical protein
MDQIFHQTLKPPTNPPGLTSPETTPASVEDPVPALAETEPLLTATICQPASEASNSSWESCKNQAVRNQKTYKDKIKALETPSKPKTRNS